MFRCVQMKLGLLLGVLMVAGVAGAGNLDIDGDLSVLGDLSVTGAIRGVQMPQGLGAASDDAATRAFVEAAVQAIASTGSQGVLVSTNLIVANTLAVGLTQADATLHVAGNALFEGAVSIEPSGDLSMGVYTNR